jgi:hypothetical protein
MLEKAAEAVKDYVPMIKEWLSASWPGFPSPMELAEQTLPMRATGSNKETLNRTFSIIRIRFSCHYCSGSDLRINHFCDALDCLYLDNSSHMYFT